MARILFHVSGGNSATGATAPYMAIQRCVHIHPTVSELIPTMLGDLQPLVDKI